jgi:predicted dehydrogenase
LITDAAASRGLPLFLEKPIAATLVDAEQMADRIEERGLPNAVDFNFSALKAFTAAREKMQAGEIGRLQHAVVNWQVESYANRHRLKNWKTEESSGGGTLQNFTSHCLHYLEWISGKTVSGLSARLSHIPGDIRTGDVTVSLQLEFSSGANAVVASSAAARHGTGHEISLYGSDGALILRNNGPDHMRGFDLFFAGRDDAMIRKVPVEEEARQGNQDSRIIPTARLIVKFVDWICGGAPVENDIMTGLRVQRLIEAARESNHRGCWVEVPASSEISCKP